MTSSSRWSTADDDHLVEAVGGGDEHAFRELYRRHSPLLFRLALYLTAGREADSRDLVQEVWLRAVQALPTFRGEASVGTWLKAILSRCASEFHRTRDRMHPAGTPLGAEGHQIRSGLDARVDLARAFERMPSGYRAVLVLHDFEGLRHREIATSLGISEGTSKSQLHRARAWLRSALGDDYARA